VTRVEVSRHVAADPASVALLLAEPPGEPEHDRAVVVTPPRRAGVGFVAIVEVIDAIGRAVTGEVMIEPATDAGCDVRLSVTAPDVSAARGIERSGSTFLSDLAARAKSRSRAA
jgi:hypothetical protein